jgi:cation transport ATPase
MVTKRTTVLLDRPECASSSLDVEEALRGIPGVLRAYVNPMTEAAYIEYDAGRCAETDFARVLESHGLAAKWARPPP